LLNHAVSRRAHDGLFEVELRRIELSLQTGDVRIDSLNDRLGLQQRAVGFGLGTLCGRFGGIESVFGALELNLGNGAGFEQLFRAFEDILR
jgi:hypothetical protein